MDRTIFGTSVASATVIMIKILTEEASPALIVLVRFLPASIMAVVLLSIFYRNSIRTTFRRHWKYFISREVIAILGFHLTWVYASSILPAGIVQLEIAIWPALTMLLASFFVDEQLTPRKMIGASLAFVGVAAVFLTKEGGTDIENGLTQWVWIKTLLILLIAPISAAVVTVITRKYLMRTDGPSKPDTIEFSLLCRMPSGVVAIIAYLILDDPANILASMAAVSTRFWIMMGVISLYNSLVGFLLWNWCIQKLNATTVSSFSHMQTGVTLVLALIFLGESLTPVKILAAVTIVGGVLLTNIGAKKPALMDGEGGRVNPEVGGISQVPEE